MPNPLPIAGSSERDEMWFLLTFNDLQVWWGLEEEGIISASGAVREKEEMQAGAHQIDKGGRAF